MDSEEIFEAVGEVVTESEREANTTLRSLFDDSIENYPGVTPSTMQSLLQSGMNDEAVIDYIFESCDGSKTGYVQASVLVEFLSNACGNNNLRDIFQQLHSILDPNELNPDIDIETFQEALKCWITSITTKELKACEQDILTSSPKKQIGNFHMRTPSKNNSISEYLSTSISSSLGELDVKELQYKFSKLQDENKALKSQMADVDEVVTTLKTENTQLKTAINRVEQEATDITAKSLHLQEDNGALQNRLEDLKEELRKMTEAYNECQNDLKRKTHELNILEVNSSKEEHLCEHLSETIRHLEEVLLNKEKELRAKDEEINRIAEALIEQQVLSAQHLHLQSEEKPVLGTETLASELHSSIGTPWKRQMMDSIVKPESIHQAAWSAMLSEPEFEDAPKQFLERERTSETPKRTYEKIDSSSVNQVSSPSELNTQPQAVEEFSVAYNGVAHSTPFKLKSFTFDTAVSEKVAEHSPTRFSPLSLFLKLVIVILFIGLAFFTTLALTIIAFVFLSSTSCDSSGCDSVSHFPQQTSTSLFRTLVWPNVISVLTPYCRIEYSGSPPV